MKLIEKNIIKLRNKMNRNWWLEFCYALAGLDYSKKEWKMKKCSKTKIKDKRSKRKIKIYHDISCRCYACKCGSSLKAIN